MSRVEWVAVLCDAPSHRKRVNTGARLALTPDDRSTREFIRIFGVAPDPDRHRERHHFECSRCGDRITIGRPETLAQLRAELARRGESSVTMSELRGMVTPR